MADSVKYSILGDPIHPEDITLRFVSNFWPEKEIIIYEKYPFSLIAPLLNRDIKKDIVKDLENCSNAGDVFSRYDEGFLRSICGLPENFRESENNLDILKTDIAKSMVGTIVVSFCADCFIFDGLPISPEETPAGLGLVDGDIIS